MQQMQGSIDLTHVNEINDNAFYNCYSLGEIKLGEGVTDIGEKAFYSCRGLKEIHLGRSLAAVGPNAFNYCTSLQNVYYDGSSFEWRSIPFSNGNDNLLNSSI